eukprot:11893787-Karenia_brevis.AAC.1
MTEELGGRIGKVEERQDQLEARMDKLEAAKVDKTPPSPHDGTAASSGQQQQQQQQGKFVPAAVVITNFCAWKD